MTDFLKNGVGGAIGLENWRTLLEEAPADPWGLSGLGEHSFSLRTSAALLPPRPTGPNTVAEAGIHTPSPSAFATPPAFLC